MMEIPTIIRVNAVLGIVLVLLAPGPYMPPPQLAVDKQGTQGAHPHRLEPQVVSPMGATVLQFQQSVQVPELTAPRPANNVLFRLFKEFNIQSNTI